MKIQLLPEGFDARIGDAVEAFWKGRSTPSKKKSKAKAKQGAGRDAVVSGQNMSVFADLVREVVQHCGIAPSSVHTRKKDVVLPGFFRATKNWDVLVIHQRRLLAVFEFKSQVGSFGNNLNNRSEEVIGSAADLWVAHHHHAFSDGPHRPRRSGIAEPTAGEGDYSRDEADTDPALLNPTLRSDPRPPFLGWLMLLEDCEASTVPVKVQEPHYRVFDEFRHASYAERYQILCERLVERQLYAAAALELTQRDSREHRALSEATSLKALFREFAGRMVAALD
jgi:hypothetical protein